MKKETKKKVIFKIQKHDRYGLDFKHYLPFLSFLNPAERKELWEGTYHIVLDNLRKLTLEASETKPARVGDTDELEYWLELTRVPETDSQAIAKGIKARYNLVFAFGGSTRNEHISEKQGYENAMKDIETLLKLL